ncbi:hypothetical protein GCM10007981_07390 [Thermocladium modestius]|uniref:Uncharacterized protein n=1 Tax=Thermocladium modestius TaxID=62609 RepID=A0A830GV81_9CREN|nr:hypothetical protein [Thermocladium modestius]GGP20215.1 hypothetical protein GCM10007981_07390 [Thermocladium modestius]
MLPLIHLAGNAPIVFLLHMNGFLIALATNFTAVGAFSAIYELGGGAVLNSTLLPGVTLTDAMPYEGSLLVTGLNGSRPFMAEINVRSWTITNETGKLPTNFQPYAAADLGGELVLGGSSQGHASLIALNGTTIINETSELPSNYLGSTIVLLAPLNGSLLVAASTQYPSMLIGVLGSRGFTDLTGRLPINPDFAFPTTVAVYGDEAFIGGFSVAGSEEPVGEGEYLQLNQLGFKPIALLLVNGTFRDLAPVLGMSYGAIFDASFINSTALAVAGGYLINSGWAPYVALVENGRAITYQLPLDGAAFAVTKELEVGGGINVFYNLTELVGEPFIATATNAIVPSEPQPAAATSFTALGYAIAVALIAGALIGLLMMSTLEDEK